MKEKLNNFLKSNIYPYFVMVLIFVFWLISYLSCEGKINPNTVNIVEWIEMIVIGVSFLLISVLSKELDPMTPIVMYTPFIYAHPFYVISMPYSLFLGIGCLVLGLIIHQIIYKPKLKFGRNFFGICALAVAMTLGGISTKAEYLKMQFFACLAIGSAILFLYYSFSNNKYGFRGVSHNLNALGVLLVLQIATFFILSSNFVESFFTKCVSVGWGIENNTSLMLLLTIPFTVYLVVTSKKLMQVLYVILTVLQFSAILFTYSRGATAAIVLGLVVMIPVGLILTKDKLTYSISLGVVILLFGGFFLVLYTKYHDYYEQFLDYALRINIDNMNGRTPIYESIIASFKENPIFGKGMLSPFYNIIETGVGEYQWGHSTFLHTLLTMGSFGVLALFYHFFEKYFYLIKKMNKEKFFVLMGFLLSEMYGMIDVSYYFINYMIVLIIALAIIENLIGKKEEADGVL